MTRLLPDDHAILIEAEHLLARLRARGLRLVTAESCTGGLIAASLTALPGASDVLAGGIVAYSNALKIALLGVPPALLAQHGAVSDPVARAMAEGARVRAAVDLAIAVTGIAGPGGGSSEKPVGLVYLAAASASQTLAERHIFPGDRAQVRAASVRAAFMLIDKVK